MQVKTCSTGPKTDMDKIMKTVLGDHQHQNISLHISCSRLSPITERKTLQTKIEISQ